MLFILKIMQNKSKLFAQSICSLYQDCPQYTLIFMYISIYISERH